MRQGEISTKGTWVGNPQGGVSTPEAVLPPDAAQRFLRTAARLEALAADHAMGDWLAFLARLSHAQHAAAAVIAPPAPDPAALAKAEAAGMPPLAAHGHRRHGAWREALRRIVGAFDRGDGLPEAVASVAARLAAAGEAEMERLADDVLNGVVPADKAGQVPFVAAALQVYFTRLAAGLSASSLHLLAERGLCPCCGSTPVAGVVTAAGNTPGVRYLHCSLCSTAWNHVRAVCITCGQSGKLVLRGIDGFGDAVKAETCDDCHSYAKVLYRAQDPDLDPYADDVASLGLDILVGEAGWSRHAANPLLLAG